MTAVNLSCLAGAGAQFFDNNGVPLAGGLLYTYSAGTTTLTATYTTNAGTIANSNPIVLDASGRVTNEIWLITGSTYKFILQTSSGTQIWSMDNIPGSNDYTSIYTALASTSSTSQGAGLIGFKQANASGYLTGAVSSTVQVKLEETVSVKDFGATGNGTTDDTSAFNSAIASGFDIYVPNGTYKITSTLTISQGYQSIYGAGKLSILNFNFGSTQPGLVFSPTSQAVGRQTVHNLTLSGIANVSKVISIQQPQTQILNCNINNATSGGHGIYLENENTGSNIYCYGTQILNNNIHGSSTSNSYGIFTGLNSQTTIISGNNIDSFDVGISVQNSTTDFTVRNNVIESCLTYAINLSGGTGSPVLYDVLIVENYFEANPVAVAVGTLNGTSLSTYENLKISDNYATASGISGTTYFYQITNCGANSQNIFIDNNYVQSFSVFLGIGSNGYGANFASVKGNTMDTVTSYSSGTYLANAYKIRQANAYFNNVIISGSFASQSVTRMEAGAIDFRVPITFEPHEFLNKITFAYNPVGTGNSATVTLYKGNGDTTTSISSTTISASGTGTITVNAQALANYFYYLEVVMTDSTGTAYIYPFNIYIQA